MLTPKHHFTSSCLVPLMLCVSSGESNFTYCVHLKTKVEGGVKGGRGQSKGIREEGRGIRGRSNWRGVKKENGRRRWRRRRWRTGAGSTNKIAAQIANVFPKTFFFFLNACVSDYQRLKDRLQNGT